MNIVSKIYKNGENGEAVRTQKTTLIDFYEYCGNQSSNLAPSMSGAKGEEANNQQKGVWEYLMI